MDAFTPGINVTRTLQYEDSNGQQLTPVTANYRVIDAAGTELVASTPVTINAGDTQTDITVLAANNGLGATELKALRVIELTIVTADTTVVVKDRYLLMQFHGLTVWTNSFIGYDEALLEADDMPTLEGWNDANERDRVRALIHAFVAINNFLFYHPDVSSESFAISELTDAEKAALPADFLQALKRAQIAEADLVLGGDWIEDKRRMGLMSETIGESSNMFRPGKPLDLPVGKRAMKYLMGYVSLSKRIGRA